MIQSARKVRDGFTRHMYEWILLIIGVVCHVGGIYCMRLAGDWKEDTKYSNAEVCGFIFGTLFFSISIPSIVYVLKAIYWMKYPAEAILVLYGLFAVLSIVGLILSCFSFDGVAYFVWNTSTNLSPVLTITALISMSLCLLWFVICLIHFTRTWGTRHVRCMLYFDPFRECHGQRFCIFLFFCFSEFRMNFM